MITRMPLDAAGNEENKVARVFAFTISPYFTALSMVEYPK